MFATMLVPSIDTVCAADSADPTYVAMVASNSDISYYIVYGDVGGTSQI
jgi:hypothetical protein